MKPKRGRPAFEHPNQRRSIPFSKPCPRCGGPMHSPISLSCKACYLKKLAARTRELRDARSRETKP
jgi:hypothetical protein